MVSQAQAVYSDSYNQITNNTALPAEARNAALEQIARHRDASIRLIETIYNVNLNWTPTYNTAAAT